MRGALAAALAGVALGGCSLPSLPGSAPEATVAPTPEPPPAPATPPLPGSAEPLPVADRAAFAPLTELPLSADVPLPGRSQLLDAFASGPGDGPGERERTLLSVDATVDVARAFHAEQLPAAGWTVTADEASTTAEGLRVARLAMSREDRTGVVRIAEQPGQPGVLTEVVVTRP